MMGGPGMGGGMMGGPPGMGGYFGGGAAPGGYAMPAYPVSDNGPLFKCLLGSALVLIMLMLVGVLALCIWILVKDYDIIDDLSNLKFRIRVPSPAPPPFRPNGK
jgi:hypothetical protein